MKKAVSLLLVTLSIFSLASCGKEQKADLLIKGKIYTGTDFVECAAIKDGKYIYVGDVESANKYIDKDKTKIENVDFAMSSGTETHGHFISEAAFKKGLYIPIDYYFSPSKIIDCVVEYHEKHPEVKKIFGYGWSQYLMAYISNPRELLDDERLDGIPVCIAADSLHALWCNTAFLKAADVYDKPCDISQVLRDNNGIATGYIMDEAVFYLRNKVFGSLLDENEYKEAVKDASKFLNSLGYTAHYDSWSNFDGTDAMYKAISEVDKDGQATMYYTSAYSVTTYSDYKQEIAKAEEYRTKYATSHYSPAFIKLFADGVVETETGYVLEPYLDTGSTGTRLFEPNHMNEIVELANKKDFMVHAHTYGDAAVRETVDAYILSNQKNNKTYRNSIAHACLVTDSDLKRIAENNIGVATAANWSVELPGDTWEVFLTSILGDTRRKAMYPDYDFVKYGIKAGVSTDRPCANGFVEDIFDYIGLLTTGIDYRGKTADQVVARRDKHLTVKEAIDMVTINGAWIGNVENTRGSIAVGKYADFVVSNKNPFEVELSKINEIDVQSTYFEGKLVYSK